MEIINEKKLQEFIKNEVGKELMSLRNEIDDLYKRMIKLQEELLIQSRKK